jgi:hypothetical protein
VTSQESNDSVDDGMRGVINDIRMAEKQIARGEGVEHDAARSQVLSRLQRRGKAPLTS